MSAGSEQEATGVSAPSVISMSTELAPRSTAANRTPGSSWTRVERRPPRDAAGPASRTRPAATMRSSSPSSRGRGTSSRSASWARDSGPLSRSRLNTRYWMFTDSLPLDALGQLSGVVAGVVRGRAPYRPAWLVLAGPQGRGRLPATFSQNAESCRIVDGTPPAGPAARTQAPVTESGHRTAPPVTAGQLRPSRRQPVAPPFSARALRARAAPAALSGTRAVSDA